MKKIALFLVFLLASTASASFIRLTTRVDRIENATEDKVLSNVVLSNTGDEPASNVYVNLILPKGFEAEEEFIGVLGINETKNKTIPINITTGRRQGLYPLVVLTRYTDANNYPFSSISPAYLVYKEPSFSDIRITIEDATIYGKEVGSMQATIINMDERGHDAYLRVFLPKEIRTEEPERIIKLAPKSSINLTFPISSLGALEGSSYYVAASIEYDDAKHYTSLDGALVKVTGRSDTSSAGESKGLLGDIQISLKTLPYILIVLCVVVLYLSFRRREPAKKKAAKKRPAKRKPRKKTAK